MSGDRSLSRMDRLRAAASDTGAAVVLALTVLWLGGMPAGLLPPGTWPVAAIALHVWLTILDGGWTVLRRVTWLLLALVWFGAVAAGFLGYVLPWGQIGFWLASQVASLPLAGDTLSGWVAGQPGNAVPSGAAVLLAAMPFAADVAVATVIRLRGRPAWRVAVFLAAAAVMAVLLWLELPSAAPAALDDVLTPADIVPRWYMLPWFAMLRAPANKLAGVVVMAAAVLLPAGAPWMRAERFRWGTAGVAWPVLCLALLADVAGLGWLGAQLPEGGVIAASQVLTAGWFAFFLLAPFLLGRFVRRRAGVPER